VFIKKRIIRIDPPYFVAVFLAGVLWYASSMFPGFKGEDPSFSIAQILFHVGYLNDIVDLPWLNPVFWTLAIEFQYYILISLILPIIISTKIKTRTIGLLILCSTAIIFPSEVFIFKYLCLFALGIVAFQYFVKLISTREFLIHILAVTLLVFLTLGQSVAIVGLASALIITFVKIEKIAILNFLGLISYSLYLIHVPIGGRVVNLGKRIADSEFEFFLISFVGVALSISIAYLFYRFVEKPSQEWSSAITYGK